jgi:hypothetical protein
LTPDNCGIASVSRDGVLIDVVDMPTLKYGSAGRSNVNAALLANIWA